MVRDIYGGGDGLEGNTQSPEHTLTLFSESGPEFVSRALSEGVLALRTLRVPLHIGLPSFNSL